MSRRSSALNPKLNVLKPQKIGFDNDFQKSQNEKLQVETSWGELRLSFEQAFASPTVEVGGSPSDHTEAPPMVEDQSNQPGGLALETTTAANASEASNEGVGVSGDIVAWVSNE